MSQNSLYVKLTAAMMMGGQMMRAGSEVEVTEIEARKLLQRGRCVLAEGETLDPKVGPMTTASLSGEDGNTSVETSPLNLVDLSALTVDQLREYAEAKSFTITATKKADIVAELQAQQDHDNAQELNDTKSAELTATDNQPKKADDLKAE